MVAYGGTWSKIHTLEDLNELVRCDRMNLVHRCAAVLRFSQGNCIQLSHAASTRLRLTGLSVDSEMEFRKIVNSTIPMSRSCVDSTPIEIVTHIDEQVWLCLWRSLFQCISHLHLRDSCHDWMIRRVESSGKAFEQSMAFSFFRILAARSYQKCSFQNTSRPAGQLSKQVRANEHVWILLVGSQHAESSLRGKKIMTKKTVEKNNPCLERCL